MKNVIPLIVAVVLALSAVYLVSRMIVQNDEAAKEKHVSVVVAASNLDAGDELRPGSCTYKSIPASAMPTNALKWDNVSLIYGQKLPERIMEGDYIQLTDLRLNVSLADCVETGKWLIPVTFSDPALVKMLIPEDEIAIVATYAENKAVPPPAATEGGSPLTEAQIAARTQIRQNRETVVLFPCVKVTGIANDRGNFREGGGSSATIFVSLPPRQATILLAAQREAELYPVLRKRNDASAKNRRELGSVNAETFERIRSRLETNELPDVTSPAEK